MTSSLTVRRNVIANFIGRAWIGIVGLVFVPVYIRLLGIEGYALIGVFLSLQALVSVLDLGLSAGLTRELARLSVRENSSEQARDLVRTLELTYWIVGILLGLTVCLAAPVIARHWLRSGGGMSPEDTEDAVLVMGLILAVQWPTALYAGGLMGTQRQTMLNVIQGLAATLQSAGAVVVLWALAATPRAFFLWQAAVAGLQSLVLGYGLWRTLPAAGRRPQFRSEVWRQVWHFSAGMTGILLLTTALTQMDKILLSKLLPLDEFGYYVLATTCASALSQLVHPVFVALFPRFAQLASDIDQTGLARTYHAGCQLVSLLVLPCAILIGLYPRELLSLWVRDPTVVQQAHGILTLSVIGTSLNAMITLPYALQLAFGWTRLALYSNLLATVFLVPLLVILVEWLGAAGASLAWILLNLGYVLIHVPLMHRRLLRGQLRSWYQTDWGVPLAVVLATGILSKLVLPEALRPAALLLWLAASGAVMFLVAAWVLPVTRRPLVQRLSGCRVRLRPAG